VLPVAGTDTSPWRRTLPQNAVVEPVSHIIHDMLSGPATGATGTLRF
jgi:hypothetical protein